MPLCVNHFPIFFSDYLEHSPTKKPSLSIPGKNKDDPNGPEKFVIKLGEKFAKFKPSNDDSTEKRVFSVEGMTCASCVAYIERNIGKLEGFSYFVGIASN